MSFFNLDSILHVWIFRDVQRCFQNERFDVSLTKGRMNVSINYELTINFDGYIIDKVMLIKAGLDGLVYCPFCPYAAIMEDPTDKEFPCEKCKVISCRDCRVKSHRPLSCESTSLNGKINDRLPKREEINTDKDHSGGHVRGHGTKM